MIQERPQSRSATLYALLILLLVMSLSLVACQGKPSEAPLGEDGKPKPLVYASFFPVYEILSSVAGDTLELRSFMPLEKDPHLWEPSPKDLRDLSQADLLVVNGANLERWLDLVREGLPDLDILVLADTVDLITYKGAAAMGDFQYMAQLALEKERYAIEFGHTHEDIIRVAFFQNKEGLTGDDLIQYGKEIMDQKAKVIPQKGTFQVEDGKVFAIEMGHEFGLVHFDIPEAGDWIFLSDRLSEDLLSYELVDLNNELLPREVLLEGSTTGYDKITYDPHSWMSIVNAKKYINSIHDELAKRYPDHQRSYRRARSKAIDALTTLEYEFKEKFAEVPGKEFVVTHYAYAYLARDFDLCQYPLQGLVSTESPSLKTIRKAVDYCGFFDLKTIFYEYGAEKKGADVLAEEIGGKAVPLASLEYLTPALRKEHASYIDLMRMNLENIYESLRYTNDNSDKARPDN